MYERVLLQNYRELPVRELKRLPLGDGRVG